MAAPLATIVLSYDDADAAAVATGSIKVEPDSERNRTVDDDGNDVEKTSFQPGDTYHFLVYHTNDVYISGYSSCAGNVNYNGSQNRSRSDVCVFTERNSTIESGNRPSLSYRPAGGLSASWFQSYSADFNVGSGISIDEDLSLTISGGAVPCQADVSYSVRFHSFSFYPPSDLTLSATDENDSVSIYVVIYIRST